MSRRAKRVQGDEKSVQRARKDTRMVPGRHFRMVTGATFTSRISGYLRDTLNAALFGTGWITDAYFMAVRIPNLLRDLFAEGALSLAFIPTLSESMKKEGEKKALQLTREVFTLLLIVVSILCALGILFAPQILSVIAHGFQTQPEKFDLTVTLTRILFPVLLFVSLAALWMGFLNTHQRFLVPAFAPVAMNLTLIVTGFYLLSPLYTKGVHTDLTLVYIWTGATTLGMFFQWFVQVPEASRLGFTMRLRRPLQHPGVMKMLRMMGPAVISQSVIQVNLLINLAFASFLPTGGVSHLYYGNRLMQLPYGVLGVSIATVVFPMLSRLATEGKHKDFSSALSRALEAAAFVMLPSTLGLIIVSLPVSRLAFEYGRFTSDASQAVAEATCFYSMGLFAYTAIKILAPAYYAHQRTRWPMVAAVGAMLANITFNLAVFMLVADPHIRFWAIALASSVGAFVNFIVLLAGLPAMNVKLEWKKILGEWGRLIIATLCMGAAAYGMWILLKGISIPYARIPQALCPALIGALVYFPMCKILRCRSMDWVFERRIKKS